MSSTSIPDAVNDITSLSTTVNADTLATWTDDKKKDFVDTFDKRSKVARYILWKTAQIVITRAHEKQFLSTKHRNAFSIGSMPADLMDKESRQDSYTMSWTSVSVGTIGGRPASELDGIADERAQKILNNLPPLKDAVSIINPEISGMINKREAIALEGKKLMHELDAVSGPMDIDDFDEGKTVKQFKEFIRERNKTRKSLVEKLDDLGREGRKLTEKIDKFLYSGLPGLTEAVVDVAKDLLEQATAFSALSRRIEEKVMFGDSQTALTMLQRFEQDEVTVSQTVKERFDAALAKLKLASEKPAAKKLQKGK